MKIEAEIPQNVWAALKLIYECFERACEVVQKLTCRQKVSYGTGGWWTGVFHFLVDIV